jgi:hypothetical protein
MRITAKVVTLQLARQAFQLIVASRALTPWRSDRASGYAMQLLPARWWAKCYARPLHVEKKRIQSLPPSSTTTCRAPSAKLLRCCTFWLKEAVAPFGGPIVNLNGLERIYTTQDASGDASLGWGLIDGQELFAGRWSDLAVMPDSTGALELCPIVARVVANPLRYRGKLYMPRTDSSCAFYAMNSGDSSSAGVLELLEALATTCRKHNIRILAEWMPRTQNFEPDMLSKLTHPRQHLAQPLPHLPLSQRQE